MTTFSVPLPNVEPRANGADAAPTAASSLVDVVNLVMKAVWADLRRSRHTIEPSQWATLRRIARGPCTMSELARYKEVSLPTMSRSVEMLVRRGWVERCIDGADRRQTIVQLTASGRRVLADCRRRAEQLLDDKLEPLSLEQRDQLASSLEIVREALGATD